MTKRRKTYDASAGTVTLDLIALEHTLMVATRDAKEALYNEMNDMRNFFEDAIRAKMSGDLKTHYTCLCSMNTHSEYMVYAAQHYAEATRAFFYISEAVKRDETLIVKEPIG